MGLLGGLISGSWKAGSVNRPVRLDASTHAIEVIDYAHHEIHAGSHYKAGYGVINQSLVTDDTVTLLFVTPNTTTWAHWELTAQATGFCRIDVYTGTTTSADGTAVTIWNRNQNSTNTPGVVVKHTPTVTSDGTKMVTKFIGGTGFKADVGGEARGDSEFILKQNTKYLIRATALDDNISIQVGGDWYEHLDKN